MTAKIGPAALFGLIWLCALPLPSEAKPIPSELRPLHILNRLAYGPRPGDIERIKEMGVERYIDQQLHPESIPVPEQLTEQIAELTTLHMTPVDLIEEYGPPRTKAKGEKPTPEEQKERRQRAQIVMEQAVAARFIRAVEGPRQLKEVMTDFWFNHFNVFAGKALDHLLAASFEEQAIRPHALGRFRDLLEATARHPAMLVYLDNWLNTAPGSPGARGKQEGLNENYARELMELHTLGVDGGYTQQDVIALARILTGWGIVRPRMLGGDNGGAAIGGLRGAAMRIGLMRRSRPRLGRTISQPGAYLADDGTGFFFDPSRHDFSDKVFLGRIVKGRGMAEVEEALDILAASPATAHHISFQLAQYFVTDNPPEPLVKRIAARWSATDGDIRAVLETLFLSPEFWDQKSYQAKFKTPYQYVVSAVRATGLPVRNARPLFGTLQQLGMPLYMCLTPDGYKNTEDAWLNPDAMMRRLSFATALASGHLPVDRPPPNEAFKVKKAENVTGTEVTLVSAGLKETSPPPPPPADFMALAETLGNRSSAETAEAIRQAPDNLKGALILGSPEFMRH